MGTFNNTVISYETTHTVAEYFSSECLGKWILWKILFWAGGRQGKFHTAWQFTLFWAFSKILCHLWLQWAECISYTCATHDILPEPSLCIVATLALGGLGRLHIVHCLPEKCVFLNVDQRNHHLLHNEFLLRKTRCILFGDRTYRVELCCIRWWIGQTKSQRAAMIQIHVLKSTLMCRFGRSYKKLQRFGKENLLQYKS